jgi:mono/diheme cytochrome c family protein
MTRTIRAVCFAATLCAFAAIALDAQAPAGPTFNKDVAPIFYKNCTSCHRPGEIAPMSLLTYADARPWAKSIATRVTNGSMPPWHADPAHGQFLNDRRLSDVDRDAIVKWVAAGAPEGGGAPPTSPTYESGWSMGQPDAVLAMGEDYPIPAEGTIAYQYFEIPTNFTEDKWIQALEVKAGDPRVLHHVIVYARTPPSPQQAAQIARLLTAPPPAPLFEFQKGTEIPAGQSGGPPLPPEQRKPLGPNDRPQVRLGPTVGGFAPGQFLRVYQEGTAMRLPAGSTLVFQSHYTTMGKATTDRTRIALKFAKQPPQIPLRWASLVNGGLHIPAGASDYRVDAEMAINQDITLWSMLPHTHLRGKRWSYEAIYPDGRNDIVLAVPKYDFNWQTDYVFKEPLKLPKGTRLHATAWYDNSVANKSNPDPTKDVLWGDQTWEEMMFTGLTFSIDNARPAPTAGR